MAEHTMTTTELLIIVSNIALFAVTLFAAYVGFKESHRHEEHVIDASDKVTEDLTKIIHEVLVQETMIESDNKGRHKS